MTQSAVLAASALALADTLRMSKKTSGHLAGGREQVYSCEQR